MSGTTTHNARSSSCPRLTRLALLVALVASFTALSATSALAISRDEVLARGQRWVDSPVPYSQARHHAGYRTDCSGYVSACWKTGTSWSTRSFHTVTHPIRTSQLRPGDAMLKKGYHIRLFYGWLDEAHTEYVAYESGSRQVAVCRIHSIADDLAFGYVPVRYDRITSSPKPRNVLQNGSFKVWAKSWGDRPDRLVWWQASGGPWWEPVATRRDDTYRSARSSLELSNPSEDPATFTELSQSAPIVAGADYRLSAWAKTDFDPHGLEMRLVYLNAADEPSAEATTTGDLSGLDGSAFKNLSLRLTAPPDAVRALVVIRLAGGTATDTAGIATPGTSVTLDDISLTRPQVSASIKTSAKTARRGRTVALSGQVAPASAVGAPAVVYVQKPGSGWKRLKASEVQAVGDGAAWRKTFTFTSGMRKGTYRFRTTVPAVPGYLGATTSVVSVTLK